MLEVYGSAGIFAGLAQLAYLATAFCVGTRLLQRARGGERLPEFLLGLHLILSMGVGYLCISFAMLWALLGKDGALAAGLVGVGYLATLLGLCAALHFNRVVFRRESRSALGFAALCGLAMAGGWLGYGLREGFAPSAGGPWFLFMTAGIVATNLWVAFEPLRYHALLRRRVRLGLAEPVVADRFLLWGCGSLARTGMAVMGLIISDLQLRAGSQAVLELAAPGLVLAALLGLTTSAAYALTFLPTRGYLRWVERRYARA
jgi:hypothetical protein